MCGIAGKVHADRQRPVDEGLVRRMCRSMAHRGPDDEGVWMGEGVGLGMRRLQVIDLPGGRQPMSNEDGSLWIVFNGEIYNYRSLRRHLEERGHELRTNSDTETILHLYEEEGENCLQALRGMFAFALWDGRQQKLFLARDRLGKKPLYYAETAGALTFASELGSLLCDGQIERQVDPVAIDEYLSYLFVPHPRTIYKAVRKLPPGSWAVYAGGELEIHRYWQVRYAPREEAPGENAERLDHLLREAVELRMIADVPLGAFLSGGLDSSLVAALMQRSSSQPVKTFSIAFEEASFSEAEHARRVASFLGTEHQQYTVSYQVRDLLPRLVEHFGEPFADSSAIPTYHLSRMTRQEVTVALSGDGGDEVFGGYRRYQARLLADLYNRWPGWLGRRVFERLATGLREPAIYYGKSPRKKLRRFLEFAASGREAAGTSWAFFLTEQEKTALYSENFADIISKEKDFPSLQPYVSAQDHAGDQAMLWCDLMAYLPDDILAKVDRMSMACSLEVRSPFLDHEVVEFMAGVPRTQKFTWGQSKRLLRRVAARYLPEEILRRPKQGFAIPLAAWLQGALRPWMEDLLLGQQARARGLFALSRIEYMVADHLRGRRDYSQQLWALMVLELWLGEKGASGRVF